MGKARSFPGVPGRAALALWLALAAAIGTALASDTNQPPAAPDLTELSFEELAAVKVATVYGASKHEQTVTEAPSAVSILTQEDIKQYGYRTLGDLLQSVRGFYVTSDRAYDFIGVLGVNRPGDFGGRVLINIDGHRMNEPLFDSAFASTDFLLDMDLVDRVEIIRGPGSSLYGNNAFFAVINVITRRGGDVNGLEFSGSAGSFDTYTGRVTYGKKFTNGVEVLVSGTYLDSQGEDRVFFPQYRSVNGGFANDLDGTTAKSTFASVSYGDFTLEGGAIDRRKPVPTSQFQTVFDNPNSLNIDEREFAELKFAREFAGDWSVQARGYYDHYRYDGIFPFNYSSPDPGPVTINREWDKAQWAGGEVLVSKTLWERQRLTLGSEVRDDFQLDLYNFDESPRAVYVNSHQSDYSFAFYGEDEVTLLTNLTLNAGVRYDYFSQFGDTVNPRGAAIYRPWQAGAFKFVYGQAFRAPNDYELNYIQPLFRANPGLQPEKIHSYELIYEQGLAARLHATGSLFWEDINGMISQATDANGLNYFANIGQVESRGFEAELEGRWQGNLRARLSYTFADARDTVTGAVLDNSPRHLGKANVVVPFWRDKFFGGFELQAMSSRTTVQGNVLSPFWVANLTLFSRELIRNLELSASLYNVFDTHYSNPLSADYPEDAVPMPGRTFRVKLTYRF